MTGPTDDLAGAATETERPLLQVTDLGKIYEPDPAVTPDYGYFAASDAGGSTSVRRVDEPGLKWKKQGYYQRNRDLGQVFSIPAGDTLQLDAVVLRTGNSGSAILAGNPGAEVYLQLFEVVGRPAVNDNGTPAGAASTHGFTRNHRADDFLDGITYRNLLVAGGGRFPELPATTGTGGQPGHLRYLRWDLLGDGELTLPGGRRYAFLVGFSTPAPRQGFTLGNNNLAADPATAALRTDARGQAWWSMRREGDGTLPPTRRPGVSPPADSLALKQESLFGDTHQLELLPTTNGFPDVDTYRVLEFYLEASSR